MNHAHASHVDSAAAGLASWYTPGRSDGFGDRLLMFDNTDAISLELLRLRRDLATTAGFEHALRDRVELLTRFRHPSFPLVRAVVHLDDQDLTLVSAHTAGQRLSELPTQKVRRGLHPAVVTWIVQEVTQGLAALQSSSPAVVHGALSADRIVLTADGRLCIVEHALGSAIQRLALTPAVFWRQFGLLAPADDRGVVQIDPRTDVVQLGTIALSLLLARPLNLHDFERGLPALLDEFSATAAASPSVFAEPLRAWLERALQLAPRSYRSAADAQEGLNELPEATPPAGFGSATLQLPDQQFESEEEDDGNHGLELLAMSRLDTRALLHPHIVRDVLPESTVTTVAPEPAVVADLPRPQESRRRWKRAYTVLIAVTLGVVALVEGAIIAGLGTQPTIVTVAAPTIPAQPQQPAVATPVETLTVAMVDTAAKDQARDSAANAAIAQAAARQRSGGIRLSLPIEVNVLEGDKVLGSTADGPIVTTEGTHQLDLVNTALGYRSHQTVTIKAGVITSLTLALPMGRVNINAQPWAQVLIDDQPVGETPLANVEVPLGQHVITFRHPQLGERRQSVTIRADTVARVSTVFDR